MVVDDRPGADGAACTGGDDGRVSIDAKIAFLSRLDTYPGETGPVAVRETHMSWVFLTARHAFKMKKPIRQERLDFSTVDKRRRLCGEEVRLNRRLAADVYLGTVALTASPDGTLALDGDGEPVEWLVRMRRLPAGGTLEALAHAAGIDRGSVVRLVHRLARFYAEAPCEPIAGAGYRQRFRHRLGDALRELGRPEFGLPRDVALRAFERLNRFVDVEGTLLDERARQDRIVEGHGDLRPEHVYLVPDLLVIDSLEFDRDLRLADPADELGYLAMECDLLGATHVTGWLFAAWVDAAGDRPPADLVDFYKGCRALHRAKLAAWHLERPGRRDRGHWLGRAHDYLELAASYAERLP